MSREELRTRIDLIEEAYEYQLAYAAQGLTGDRESKSGGELRSYLERLEAALDGLGDLFLSLASEDGVDPGGELSVYVEVLDRDALSSLAAVRLVRAQPSISSALVDNLNGSIHVRALLTDIFLVDEILKILPQDS